MLKNVIIFLSHIFILQTQAQQKDFEGKIEYRVEVQSRIGSISDQEIRNVLFEDIKSVNWIRQGNYRVHSGKMDTWYINKDQKVYFKFKDSDTLYFRDYADDTSTVISVEKTKMNKTIGEYDCSQINIETNEEKKQYYYAKELYNNPAYDKNNRIGRMDVYSGETSSIWLSAVSVTQMYILSYLATKVEPGIVADSLFKLPDLPQRKFNVESLKTEPVFKGSGGWAKYITMNVNPNIAGKYLRIPKGQQEATQIVFVAFRIDPSGKVSFASVTNPKEVHPKIAEEALRVIKESPDWKPATMFGQKTIFWLRQPIVFKVTK